MISYTFKNRQDDIFPTNMFGQQPVHNAGYTYAKLLNFHSYTLTFIEKAKKVFSDTIILSQVRLLNEYNIYMYLYRKYTCI